LPTCTLLAACAFEARAEVTFGIVENANRIPMYPSFSQNIEADTASPGKSAVNLDFARSEGNYIFGEECIRRQLFVSLYIARRMLCSLENQLQSELDLSRR
jgi:hypothetical protein